MVKLSSDINCGIYVNLKNSLKALIIFPQKLVKAFSFYRRFMRTELYNEVEQ
jgi:hypothetical protein